jgi:hypothetical protein
MAFFRKSGEIDLGILELVQVAKIDTAIDAFDLCVETLNCVNANSSFMLH